MHSVAEARCVARTGSWASFDRSRDCHRGGFSRLESGTTTPLPPPQKRPGVRADFLHVKKKKKKGKGLRDPGHGPSRNTCVVGLRKDKEMLAQEVLVSWEIQC